MIAGWIRGALCASQRLRFALHSPHGQKGHRCWRDSSRDLSSCRISDRKHRVGTGHQSSANQQETESLPEWHAYHRERREDERPGYVHLRRAQRSRLQRERNVGSSSHG